MEPLPTEQPLDPEPPLGTVLVEPPAPPAEAAPAPRPRVWSVLLTVPLYFGAVLMAGLVVGIIAGFVVAARDGAAGGPPDPARVLALLTGSPALWLALALLPCAAGAGIALLGGSLSPEPLRARLALGRSGLRAGTAAVACLGLLLLGSVPQELLGALGIPITGAFELFGRMVRGLSPGMLAPAALVVGVVVPIGEELLFRGYVQSRLCRRWGTWPGIVLAAAFFGLAHLDPIQSPSAFLAGLYLGWLARRTGSTIPGMIVHAVNNLAAVATTWAIPDVAMTRTVHAVLLVGYLVTAAAAIAWLARRLPRGGDARPAPEGTRGDENAAPLGG